MAAPCSLGCLSRSAGSWSSTASTGSLPADDGGTVVTARRRGDRPSPASPWPDDSRDPGPDILDAVDPIDKLRLAGKRVTDPLESLAQRVAERVIDLAVDVLDLNALVQAIDLNAVINRIDINGILKNVDVSALIDQVDINEILQRVDVGALLDRVDMNDLVRRLDMDALVEQTDLGAIIARSSGGVASEALDAARSQAVGLDGLIDRWVKRAPRRKHPAPSMPPALLEGQPVESQPPDAEPANAEPADAEPADAEPADAEPADAEPADAQPPDVRAQT